MVHESLRQPLAPVGHSQFYMWRCVVALAHADGRVAPAERDYLNGVFSRMNLTAAQKSTFHDDLANPQDLPALLRQINEPEWRGQLIYFGGLLARADGDLDPSEDAILKKLHADQLASLDMEQIRRDVKKAVDDEMFRHDLKMSELRPHGNLAAVIDSLLLRLGIDLQGE
ncbi:MAG TPA: DUF533 domain-containing protein [Patescibacteria group bacterium]|nr:DUF533 domain-containing protein [Patescibacteria group bacterium]